MTTADQQLGKASKKRKNKPSQTMKLSLLYDCSSEGLGGGGHYSEKEAGKKEDRMIN